LVNKKNVLNKNLMLFLCILSDVRDLCAKKFTKYGTHSVKIFYKNQERVAFVNFTNCEDARKARHAKTGLIWENIQIVLEP
jgi:hypothetical protein